MAVALTSEPFGRVHIKIEALDPDSLPLASRTMVDSSDLVFSPTNWSAPAVARVVT